MPMADHLPGLDPQVDVALPRRLNESTPQGVVASDIAGIPASFSDRVAYHRRQLRYEETCVGATAAVKSHVLGRAWPGSVEGLWHSSCDEERSPNVRSLL